MRSVIVVTVALTFASLGVASAADIDPEACFCLQHPSGQSQRGCRVEKFPGQFFQTAICLDPENLGATAETLMTPTWTVVMEGEEGCEVCRPEGRETSDVPRGEDEDQEKATE